MIEAWCVRCKKKVEIKNPIQSQTKKGTPMVRGVCPICGTKVCRMGRLEGGKE